MCCVRGPRYSTGRILVRGSMTNQTHSTCVAQRSRVRRQVQLEMGKVQRGEEALVQRLRVLASSGQKGW